MRLQWMLLLPVVVSWVVAGLLSLRLADRIRFPVAAVVGIFVTGFLTVIYLVADYFTGEGITEAVIFHILYGPEGIGIWQFPELLLSAAGSLGVLTVSSYALFRHLSRGRARTPRAPSPSHARVAANASVYGLLLFSVTAHPAVVDTLHILERHSFQATSDSQDFVQHLRPIEVGPAGSRRKNLVYLYVESLERTYFDEQRFPGLIQELRKLERESLSFTGLRQAKLTDWTIAGMTASQCGVPLATYSRRNQIAAYERFLPGTTCLGDILADEGYTLAYRGGADLNFSGKGRFYAEHGFDDVRGLHELLRELPAGEPVSRWGIYDDRLLSLVYEQHQALSRGSRPFGLFALTLDTHAPNGHETPACRHIRYGDGRNPLLNAVACADYLTARFIRKILSSPGGRDTLLVVGSDHLALRGSSTELLNKNGSEARRNLLLVFNSGLAPAQVSRPGSTLDIWPTVINLMGLRSEGLALGRNLLGSEPTLVETMGPAALDEHIEQWRLHLFAMDRRD